MVIIEEVEKKIKMMIVKIMRINKKN